MMRYKVSLSDKARKALKRIDRYQAEVIVAWLENNLQDCQNPRLHGSPLVGNMKGFWRYRVGQYRIIAEIRDSVITIEIINIGHRREIYQ